MLADVQFPLHNIAQIIRKAVPGGASYLKWQTEKHGSSTAMTVRARFGDLSGQDVTPRDGGVVLD